MNHIKKIVVLTYLLVFLVGCSKIQSEEFNEEITKDGVENIDIEKTEDYVDSISTELLGYIVFADSEKIIIDEQNWVTPRDEEWKIEYDSYIGFQIVDVAEENFTYPVAEECLLFLLDKKLRQELEKYEYASSYDEIDTEHVTQLFWITMQEGIVVSIKEQYLP